VNLSHLTRFLVELSYNNDKPWFDKHRAEYQSLRDDFVRFVSRVITETALRLERRGHPAKGLFVPHQP
jgi:uncharacterized protein (DUF2461 family)